MCVSLNAAEAPIYLQLSDEYVPCNDIIAVSHFCYSMAQLHFSRGLLLTSYCCGGKPESNILAPPGRSPQMCAANRQMAHLAITSIID